MSNGLETMLAYASAFEETYKDDDWTRLAQYFSDDAVYEVRGGPLACELTGHDAIFNGLKKSLDGLDRQCDKRHIDVLGQPEITTSGDGEQIALDWRVRYGLGDRPEAGFKGRSIVQVSNGLITHLCDEYTDEEMDQFGAWIAEHQLPLDGSYV